MASSAHPHNRPGGLCPSMLIFATTWLALTLCVGAMDMGSGSGMSMSTAAPLTGCYANSSMAMCASFAEPSADIQQDILDLCVTANISMSWMTGCSVWEACKAGTASGPPCDPFTIVTALCLDMPMMAGCRRWVGLCGTNTTRVGACAPAVATAGVIPTTVATQKTIVAMCNTMPMDGCQDCTGTGATACPHPLETLSQLCMAMDMGGCSSFTTMCSAEGSNLAAFCGGTTPSSTSSPSSSTTSTSGSSTTTKKYLPPMRMYFHDSDTDVILFRGWVPDNKAQYAFSCIFVIFIGVLSQGLKALRVWHEAGWTRRARTGCGKCASGPTTATAATFAPFFDGGLLARNAVRCVFTFIVMLLDYSLMLIAMTYNVGLFLCVVSGFALGALLFGHVPEFLALAGAGSTNGGDRKDAPAMAPDSAPCCAASKEVFLVEGMAIGNSACHNDVV